ncbi:MAG: NlpC/P60 family protein [Cellulosilyticum sp.]|nr:NlpC/P60 family protein [Cellulosilyticum sp.]
MLESRRLKGIIGLGMLLVPSMIFGQTSEDMTTTSGISKVNQLNIRSFPDGDTSSIIGQLKAGEEVKITYKVGKFYKVYTSQTSGFVFSDYIDTQELEGIREQNVENVRDIVTGEAKVEEVVSSIGDQIVAEAMKYLGNPYVYGGNSLTSGTDCSGFTQGVMKLMGINIPRTSKAQSKVGTLIAKDNMQVGDLLFFGNSQSSIFHVGIYMGNGKMIHASTSSKGIIISDAFSGGGAPLQVIRRVC